MLLIAFLGTNYDHDPIRDPIPDPIRDPVGDPVQFDPDFVAESSSRPPQSFRQFSRKRGQVTTPKQRWRLRASFQLNWRLGHLVL